MFNLFTTVYADGGQATNAMATYGSLIWIVLLFVLMYFMMIRPQKKQQKEMQKMLAALEVGDKVVTIGGICGKVTKLKDDVVYIETGFMANPNERTTLKMERSSIKTVQTIHEDTV